jgi:hypothetical protein
MPYFRNAKPKSPSDIEKEASSKSIEKTIQEIEALIMESPFNSAPQNVLNYIQRYMNY